MTKALGFLTGVCLTGVLFALSIDRWDHEQPGERSPAEIANTTQPANTASKAIDEAPNNPGHNPNDFVSTAERELSESHGVPIADVVEATSTGTGTAIVPPPPIKDNGERQNQGGGPLSVSQTATVEKHDTEVAAKGIDSPTPDQDRQQLTGIRDNTRTHIFWSPFRSEWAAKGFARRLTDATQVNIDVIEAERGRYRASFNYQDESQRLEHIDRIESITGLQLE